MTSFCDVIRHFPIHFYTVMSSETCDDVITQKDIIQFDIISSISSIFSSQIIKFRLGSHKLPVETGRWYGIRNRNDRVCSECGVLGDEVHYLYNCAQIKRDDVVLPQNLDELWQNPNVFKLFSRLKEIGVL